MHLYTSMNVGLSLKNLIAIPFRMFAGIQLVSFSRSRLIVPSSRQRSRPQITAAGIISGICRIVRIFFLPLLPLPRNRDSVVGMATGYGLEDRGVGVRVPVESRIFFSPSRQDRLWAQTNLLSNEYRRLLPRA
jgi:hypothetical protein